MNTRAIVARLNELNQRLCDESGIPRPDDATTLDEAITISAATTERLVSCERNVRNDTASAIGQSPLTDFLQAQVEARQMRASERVDLVRSLTAGVRRMKKAGSLQGLGRQACTELCEALGFRQRVTVIRRRRRFRRRGIRPQPGRPHRDPASGLSSRTGLYSHA